MDPRYTLYAVDWGWGWNRPSLWPILESMISTALEVMRLSATLYPAVVHMWMPGISLVCGVSQMMSVFLPPGTEFHITNTEGVSFTCSSRASNSDVYFSLSPSPSPSLSFPLPSLPPSHFLPPFSCPPPLSLICLLLLPSVGDKCSWMTSIRERAMHGLFPAETRRKGTSIPSCVCVCQF